MGTTTFEHRRGQIQTYFDRTAVQAWARLTSDQKLGRIRATVRAGRDRMRATLRGYLEADIAGHTVLDAGSGTGALAGELARAGAFVTGVELSPTLANIARTREAGSVQAGFLDFVVGDMTDPALGEFDHVVAMDSLIHYSLDDVLRVLCGFAGRTGQSILFTFAPSTPLLAAFGAVGKLLPRGNRSPSIVPIGERRLRRRLAAEPGLRDWRVGRSVRIASGFYTSQAVELVRA